MTETKTLKQWAEEFIVYKRRLGYVYETQEHFLNRFVEYSVGEDSNPKVCILEKNCTEQYLGKLSAVQGTLYGTIAVLREFGRYLHNHGQTQAYIVPPKQCRLPVPEPPYFFTEQEIEDFFSAIDTIEEHPSFKGREIVLPAMFRLMYCCGLRCKEVRLLKCENVHLEGMYIDILQSKGPKSRRIFISQELNEYLLGYEYGISRLFPEREYFLPNKDGGYCSESMISGNFKRFWKKAYPDSELAGRPRAYDFRHHFALANLNRWVAEGMGINVMLAYLMRYMGHQSISETLYYFHFVPEFFPRYGEMTRELEEVLPEVGYENELS